MCKNELITVVVPIYNVEKYLDRCVTSIVNQTYSNLEILLIDDGSPDKCPEICDLWSKKDKRIKVIHKKNAGLGEARNTGIENARGNYICFFDSDDYIDLETIEKTFLQIKQYNSQIALFGLKQVDSKGKVINSIQPNIKKFFYTDKEIVNFILPNLIYSSKKYGENPKLWMSACMAMFSMDLIRKLNWKFVSERKIISEDVYSLLVLFKHVTNITIIPKCFYYYCSNMESLTLSFREDRYTKLKDFYLKSVELFPNVSKYYVVRERLRDLYLSFTIAALKSLVHSDKSLEKKFQLLRLIINDEMLQKSIFDLQLKSETLQRKIIFYLINKKMYHLIYLLLYIK